MRTGLLFLLCLWIGLPAYAQQPVTDDSVNEVARKLYCPVCENIPLDACGTLACIQWRDEIRSLLASGMNSDEIISDFVRRYGDRVVGIPQDPLLNALSVVVPWLISGLAVAGAVFVFVRWRGQHTLAPKTRGQTLVTDDDYRAQLEHDVRARR